MRDLHGQRQLSGVNPSLRPVALPRAESHYTNKPDQIQGPTGVLLPNGGNKGPMKQGFCATESAGWSEPLTPSGCFIPRGISLRQQARPIPLPSTDTYTHHLTTAFTSE